MHLYPVSVALLILCFATLIVHGTGPNSFAGDVSINCGSTGEFTSVNGREWLGDRNPKLFSALQMKGSSTSSPVIHKKLISVDELLYNTARISKFQFSYAFKVNPGQKIIRFHFNPTPYKGFQGLRDLFTVEAGPFPLLGNFSASLVAEALGVNYFVKEFCLFLHQDEQLNIIFTPASSSPSINTYAFINGIEIISVPSDVSYFHGGDIGVRLVGHKSLVSVDYSTALERIHKLMIKQNSLQDVNGIFPGRLAQKVNTVKNSTWKIPVDMGFRYLIRLHLSELGHKIAGSGNDMFNIFINEMTADTNIGIGKERNENNIPWYMDYMVMMRGQKEQVKRDLLISILLDDKITAGHGPLEAVEVLKLSNHDNSLATPNPLPLAQDSPCWTILTLLLVLGHGNALVTVAVIAVSLINIIVHKLQEISESSATMEENKPLVRAQQVCRHFSLAEIKLATRNFSDGLLIGRGGFGKVYKGFIDNGQTVVAVKRLKANSSQGAREFLIEIETLSELRHFNLVSLCGYCSEHGEMLLVYDYMVGGTLADHLFKLPSDSNNCSLLTWKQRLNICIGAARGLDYLHTGHGIIHRDVKSSNILLDENFVAKVSDFGLAKYEDRSKLESHVSTKVKGTKGYWDPHYISTGKLTRKSDTYSFGVVLLETLCGRRAVDWMLLEDDEQILIKWARENINKGNVYQIVALNLRDEISERSLKTFVAVAERCLHDDPKKRPTMAQLVVQLESVLELQDECEIPSASDGKMGKLALSSPEADNVTPGSKEKTGIESFTVPKVEDEQKNPSSPLREPMSIETVPEDKKKRKRAWPLRFWSWSLDAIRVRVKQSEKFVSPVPPYFCRHFSLQEIKAATGNFNERLFSLRDSRIVYKGVIGTTMVAVNRWDASSGYGLEEFETEIEMVSKLKHIHVVSFIGCCIDNEEMILVYEYTVHGNLRDRLYNTNNPPLKWKQRLQICLGLAKGLDYLQTGVEYTVIHGNFQSTSILLDENWVAKVSDFGVSTACPIDESHISTMVNCTIGYLDPNYFQTWRLTAKSDVYSSGVVLLEVLCARPAIIQDLPTEERNLATWAVKCHQKGTIDEIIDSNLKGQIAPECLNKFVETAIMCVRLKDTERPTMRHVVSNLEIALQLQEAAEALV